MTIKVGEGSTYINTGDWIHYFTYAVFDGEELKLLDFKDGEL
jgi:metallophosphoesterase